MTCSRSKRSCWPRRRMESQRCEQTRDGSFASPECLHRGWERRVPRCLPLCVTRHPSVADVGRGLVRRRRAIWMTMPSILLPPVNVSICGSRRERAPLLGALPEADPEGMAACCQSLEGSAQMPVLAVCAAGGRAFLSRVLRCRRRTAWRLSSIMLAGEAGPTRRTWLGAQKHREDR